MGAEPRMFGTDGVRGVANEDITVELAMDLARAAGEGGDGPVVIGRDTRRSGPMLATAMHAGFNSVGVDTVDVGIVPVAAVSRLTRDTGARFGVMVSASHNPAPDNGLKFFGRDGRKLSDAREDKIESRYRAGAPWTRPTGAGVGIQSTMSNAADRYIDYLAQFMPYNLMGMEVVVDCANGAAFTVAPRLFERLRATAEIHGDTPDGTNINAGCGATHPEYLSRVVNGRVGFAFDGDADRLIAVDEEGKTANGDVLMAIFAEHLLAAGKLRNETVVATVMSNLGFHRAMDRLGVSVRTTQVGDRYVLEEMQAAKASLGGEQSGHLIFDDRTTGDGLRSALLLLEVLASTGKPLVELRKVMTEYPQVMHNVRVADKEALANAAALWSDVRDAESDLGDEGRVLVRASGTEPLVRVMVEAMNEADASRVALGLVDSVRRDLGSPETV